MPATVRKQRVQHLKKDKLEIPSEAVHKKAFEGFFVKEDFVFEIKKEQCNNL